LSDLVGQTAASPDGQVVFGDLSPGEYEIEVIDSMESTWLSRQIELQGPLESLWIEIPRVQIRGRVSFGGEAVAATLSFGSTQGLQDIRIATDEEGRFAGFLPREGKWPLEVIFAEDHWIQAFDPVEVVRRPGKSFAELEVELPKTRVLGRVTFRDRPVAEADVVIVREGSDLRREAVLKTNGEGFFFLRGVREGALTLRAYDGHRSSGWVPFFVAAAQENRLELELDETRTLVGQVHAPWGAVPGASLAWTSLLPSGISDTFQQVTSGPAGEFEVTVSAQAESFDVVVVAAGLAAEWLHFAAPREDAPGPFVVELLPQGGDLLIQAEGTAEEKLFPRAIELRRDGQPINLAVLLSPLHSAGRAELQQEGFQLFGLAPGYYQACQTTLQEPLCASGMLAPGGDLVLRLVAANAAQEG
jgi:hypothetical protein